MLGLVMTARPPVGLDGQFARAARESQHDLPPPLAFRSWVDIAAVLWVIVCLAGGLGFGVSASWRYIRRRSADSPADPNLPSNTKGLDQ